MPATGLKIVGTGACLPMCSILLFIFKRVWRCLGIEHVPGDFIWQEFTDVALIRLEAITNPLMDPLTSPLHSRPLTPTWLCVLSAPTWSIITKAPPGSPVTLATPWTLVTLVSSRTSGCTSALHPFGSTGILLPSGPTSVLAPSGIFLFCQYSITLACRLCSFVENSTCSVLCQFLSCITDV